MSNATENDSLDFDLETFVDLFDTAMTSNNPAVKKAFKNLLMVTAIVHAKENEIVSKQGPLRRLVDDIQNLNRRLSDLEGQKIYPGGGLPSTLPAYSPTWIGPNTIPTYPGGPNITCGTTAFDDQFAPDPEVLGLYDKLQNK
jgi:hypothetical protein